MADAAVKIDAQELAALQDAFKAAGKEAVKDARNTTNQIGRAMKAELMGAGMVMQGPLAAHVAKKLKFERRQVFRGRDGVVRASKFTGGYVPVIAIGMGGELPVSRNATARNPKPTAEQVWAGTEFGGNRTFPQGGARFRPRREEGYWFFPTWKRMKDHYADMWQKAMNDLLRKWGAPGGFGG